VHRTGLAWTEDRIRGRGRTEDRTGPKNARIGPDWTDQDRPFAFCWATMRHGLPVPNGMTVPPLFPYFFLWALGLNFQPSDAASNAARSARAAFFPRKKILLKFGPSVRGGSDRTEDWIWQKFEPKTGSKRTGPIRSGLVRSGPRSGPILDRKLHTPTQHYHKRKKRPKRKGAPIISIFQVFETQPLQTLWNRVYGQLSRGQFVGTKNLIICDKFKINLNWLFWVIPFN